jgi:hypothetical protein
MKIAKISVAEVTVYQCSTVAGILSELGWRVTGLRIAAMEGGRGGRGGTGIGMLEQVRVSTDQPCIRRIP